MVLPSTKAWVKARKPVTFVEVGSAGGLAGASLAAGHADDYSNSARLITAHGLAALRTTHLKTWDTTLMGGLGSTGRTDAGIRDSYFLAGSWPS